MKDLSAFLNYQAPKNILSNKIIVVTGAGDGLGKAASIAFADYGATVILLGRTMSKLESTYDIIEARGNATPAIFPINFESATAHDYQQLNDILKDNFESIDGLLHNAAELGPRTPIQNYSPTEWHKVLQVNTTAPFMLTQALLPLFSKSKAGRIVFTNTTVGNKGRAYWGGYAVSKAASANLMEVLADELEQTPTRVNSINPGPVRTNLRANAYPAEDPTTISKPEDIMNRYLFLMSSESDDWNGLHLDAQPEQSSS